MKELFNYDNDTYTLFIMLGLCGIIFGIYLLITEIMKQQHKHYHFHETINNHVSSGGKITMFSCSKKHHRIFKHFMIMFSIPHLKIKGVFMSTVAKKSQFKAEMQADGTTPTGRKILHGHINPVDDALDPEKLKGGSVKYGTSDATIGTIEVDPTDETKYILVWQKAGKVQFTSQGNADLNPDGPDDEVIGTLDMEFVDDEATKILMNVDDLDTPAANNSGGTVN